MKPRILVALTTIPRRLKSSVPDVFACLKAQDLEFDVVISVPRTYRKWGAIDESAVSEIPNWVNLHRPTEDFGPATKLLGALEFASNRNYDHIITVDDDVIFSPKNYLSYLAGYSSIDPDAAWTVGGIQLSCWPYHNRFGLRYNSEYCYVNAVRGVAGTVYPVRKLLSSNLPYSLRNKVLSNAFHDDDAYFGAVLHSMDIPIIAVPSHPHGGVVTIASSGESAVAEKQDRDRKTNESEFFRFCVRNKLIGNNLLRRQPSSANILKMQNHYQEFSSPY